MDQPCGVGAFVVAREAADGFGVSIDGAHRQTAHGHGVYHAWTPWAHGFAPEVPGNIPQALGCAKPYIWQALNKQNAVAGLAHQPPRQRFSSTWLQISVI
jgi:hypothetical protein